MYTNASYKTMKFHILLDNVNSFNSKNKTDITNYDNK